MKGEEVVLVAAVAVVAVVVREAAPQAGRRRDLVMRQMTCRETTQVPNVLG